MIISYQIVNPQSSDKFNSRSHTASSTSAKSLTHRQAIPPQAQKCCAVTHITVAHAISLPSFLPPFLPPFHLPFPSVPTNACVSKANNHIAFSPTPSPPHLYRALTHIRTHIYDTALRRKIRLFFLLILLLSLSSTSSLAHHHRRPPVHSPVS